MSSKWSLSSVFLTLIFSFVLFSFTTMAADEQVVPATVDEENDYIEIVYDDPVIVLDDDKVSVAITGLKLEYGKKIWYYYTVKNNSADLYIREFIQGEAFNDLMVDYSSYTSEGSSGAVPPGKNSGIRGKGSGDVSSLKSAADIQSFSGEVRIYPSDDPNSYGGSHGEDYTVPFSIKADVAGIDSDNSEGQDVSSDPVVFEDNDEYAQIIFNTPVVIVDDDLTQIAITDLKLEKDNKLWFYYTILNKSDSTYIREFFQGLCFGDYMVDYSSYTPEGSDGSVPPGKNSGIRGKGTSDLSAVKTIDDLKNFSGEVRIFPSDDPNSYGGSHGQDYTISFVVNADELLASSSTGDSSIGEETLSDEAANADISEILQGSWEVEGGVFSFSDGKVIVSSNGIEMLGGTYEINEAEKSINCSMVASDGNVNVEIPYDIIEGTLHLYNNQGSEMVKEPGSGPDPIIDTVEENSSGESVSTEIVDNEAIAEITKPESLTPNFVFHTDVSNASEGDVKYETLTVGSSGDAVVKLQTALIEKQLLDGTADGKYGNMTAGAVSAFQESAGIAATGEADSVTQEILYGEYVEPEIDVAQVLQEGTWLFNGGDDLILNGISFSDTNATLAQVYFDGNGKHENDSQALPYSINDDSITLTLVDGSTMEVPFEVQNGQLCLNNGEWKTVADVKAGLQGNWVDKYNDFGVDYEYHTTINGDLFSTEDANSNGYYFGPYEGQFELNFGGIDADFMHSDDWFYNIIGDEVRLLRFDNIFEKTDVGLLGQGGYSF